MRSRIKNSRVVRRMAFTLLAILVALVLLGWLAPQRVLDGALAAQRLWAGAQRHAAVIDGQHWVWLEKSPVTPEQTLVLVHGFTGSKENWLPVVPKLAERFRVLVPDLPGWGESERMPDADHGYAAQAERLSRFIAQLAPKGQVVLVGHSMGGGITALLAARHPGQVKQLVLMDASGVRFEDNRFGQAVLDGENPFAVHDGTSLRRYLQQVFQHPPFVPWPLGRALIQRRTASANFEQAVLDSIARGPDAFQPAREAPSIRSQTLLLWCREDQVIDPSASAMWHQLIHSSRQQWLDRCNHMPMMERPRATATALIACAESFAQSTAGGHPTASE